MIKKIKSKISFFPFYYLITIYLIYIIFPEKIWLGKSLFQLWSHQEYFSEHFQFIFYFSASIISGLNILKNKYSIFSWQNLYWLIFMLFVLILSYEEISYLNNFNNTFFNLIKSNSTQKEINLHNLKYLENYLHIILIVINLFFGYFGWKYFSNIDAIPKKNYSFYFLLCGLSYTIFELNSLLASTILIGFHQEIYEFLMALGLFLHSLKMFKAYIK